MQHSELLADKFADQGIHSSNVAARPIEAGDHALLNRIKPITEDYRDRIGRSLGCTDRNVTAETHNHGHSKVDQIGGQIRQAIRIVVCPANLDPQIRAFDVAGIFESLAEIP